MTTKYPQHRNPKSGRLMPCNLGRNKAKRALRTGARKTWRSLANV